jgi:hypothetical protein
LARQFSKGLCPALGSFHARWPSKVSLPMTVVGHRIAEFMVNLGSDQRPSRNVSRSAVRNRDVSRRPSECPSTIRPSRTTLGPRCVIATPSTVANVSGTGGVKSRPSGARKVSNYRHFLRRCFRGSPLRKRCGSRQGKGGWILSICAGLGPTRAGAAIPRFADLTRAPRLRSEKG